MLTMLVNRLDETMPHIHFCGREAKALGIQLICTREEVEEDPAIIYQSAMGTMEMQRYAVQDMLNSLQDKKNGELLHSRFRWQQLSLSLRKRINSLFDAAENEQKSGNWKIDDRAARAFELRIGRA